MSVVTNVILCTFIEDAGINSVQNWLNDQNMPPLVEITPHAGGNKAMECEVWVGAYNWLVIEEFVDAVKSAPWTFPEDVQMFIKGEWDDLFSLRIGAMGHEESAGVLEHQL